LSRLKSARAAKPAKPAKPAKARAGAGAAPRGGRVLVQTPKSDVYVALLGVALGAILLGCLLLLLQLNRYEFQTKVAAATPPSAATLWS
jgi:hypothetical protein